MKFESLQMVKRFFLFAALMLPLAGCGGSGSSTSATSNNGTGTLAAKLVWGGNNGSSQGKVLALPGIVQTVRITVSAGTGPAMDNVVGTFTAASGGGPIPGIPVGSGRTVTAEGLDGSGLIAYQGQVTGITINPGPNDAVAINMASSSPVTTASLDSGTYGSAQSVTLTSNPSAIIYYTTNGADPTTGSAHGTGSIADIPIATSTVLKFFADLTGITPEAIKTKTYTITGSVTVNVTAI